MLARAIAKFALFFGVISSIFDFITISSLVYLLNASPELFRTGWFIESVISEIIVTFSIRTKRRFYQSRPSSMLIATSAIVASFALIFVYSPIGLYFEFIQPPLWFLGTIFGILACYFLIVEGLKHFFFNRYRNWQLIILNCGRIEIELSSTCFFKQLLPHCPLVKDMEKIKLRVSGLNYSKVAMLNGTNISNFEPELRFFNILM